MFMTLLCACMCTANLIWKFSGFEKESFKHELHCGPLEDLHTNITFDTFTLALVGVIISRELSSHKWSLLNRW